MPFFSGCGAGEREKTVKRSKPVAVIRHTNNQALSLQEKKGEPAGDQEMNPNSGPYFW